MRERRAKREILLWLFDAPDLNHVRTNGSQQHGYPARLINQSVIGDCGVVTEDVTGEIENEFLREI